jgi:hypothetical protein
MIATRLAGTRRFGTAVVFDISFLSCKPEVQEGGRPAVWGRITYRPETRHLAGSARSESR